MFSQPLYFSATRHLTALDEAIRNFQRTKCFSVTRQLDEDLGVLFGADRTAVRAVHPLKIFFKAQNKKV